MVIRIQVILLVLAGIAAGAPTSQPAKKFPTPAELVAQMKKMEAEKAKLKKVAYVRLDHAISEKPAGFSWFALKDDTTLRSLIDRLHAARDDKDIRALLITWGEASMNLAQAQEVRDALMEIRKAGKKSFFYADSYDTTAYSVACGASDICLMEGGEIMMPGIGFETMFYRGTLDKVGVEPDYIQIGEYKGAEEPYTRTGPSDELRGELTKLSAAMFEQVIDGISTARELPREKVRTAIDDAMMTAGAAKERGFIDHVVDQDGLRDLIREQVGGDIDLIRDYGSDEEKELDYSNPWSIIAELMKKPEPSDKPAIAMIYAEGVITDGEGGSGLFSEEGVGSEPMRRAFRTALKDDSVKAVVIRIDSPGGSALASEVMWQAARRVAAKKPVIVSVGSMAASGGYYLASAGDYIFADPSGIVGSIGVVGGKFVLKGLFEKIGLATETFKQGENAGLFSSNEPWSDKQRTMVRSWMQQTYDQFTHRVMTTRAGKIKDIDKVARGRIFLANEAKDLGMVDELGGTQAAIEFAATKGDLKKGEYEIRVLPAAKTLADFLSRSSDVDAKSGIVPKSLRPGDALLQALPAGARRAIREQLQILQLMERRPVILAAPFTITVR